MSDKDKSTLDCMIWTGGAVLAPPVASGTVAASSGLQQWWSVPSLNRWGLLVPF